MCNLPKYDSKKAAKNLNKTYEIRYSQNWWSFPSFKNVVEAISTGGQTGPHTLMSQQTVLINPFSRWYRSRATSRPMLYSKSLNKGTWIILCSWHSFYWLMHRLTIVTLEDGWSWPARIWNGVRCCLCLLHPFPAAIIFGNSHHFWEYRVSYVLFRCFAAFSESNFGKLYITGFLNVCSLLLL